MKPSFAPAAIILFALTACGTDKPTPNGFCPSVAVLAQASTLTAYLPGRTDIGAEITAAQITGVAGSCTLVKKNSILRVKFQAGFNATNGPADSNAPVTLPYFVAISRGDDIISKTNYSITMNFDGNATTASATSKPVTVELSNVPESAQTEILVGFQLTPQQLAAGSATP
jgi:hypothetical protein